MSIQSQNFTYSDWSGGLDINSNYSTQPDNTVSWVMNCEQTRKGIYGKTKGTQRWGVHRNSIAFSRDFGLGQYTNSISGVKTLAQTHPSLQNSIYADTATSAPATTYGDISITANVDLVSNTTYTPTANIFSIPVTSTLDFLVGDIVYLTHTPVSGAVETRNFEVTAKTASTLSLFADYDDIRIVTTAKSIYGSRKANTWHIFRSSYPSSESLSSYAEEKFTSTYAIRPGYALSVSGFEREFVCSYGTHADINVDDITTPSSGVVRFILASGTDMGQFVAGQTFRVKSATNSVNNGMYLITSIDTTNRYLNATSSFAVAEAVSPAVICARVKLNEAITLTDASTSPVIWVTRTASSMIADSIFEANEKRQTSNFNNSLFSFTDSIVTCYDGANNFKASLPVPHYTYGGVTEYTSGGVSVSGASYLFQWTYSYIDANGLEIESAPAPIEGVAISATSATSTFLVSVPTLMKPAGHLQGLYDYNNVFINIYQTAPNGKIFFRSGFIKNKPTMPFVTFESKQNGASPLYEQYGIPLYTGGFLSNENPHDPVPCAKFTSVWDNKLWAFNLFGNYQVILTLKDKTLLANNDLIKIGSRTLQFKSTFAATTPGNITISNDITATNSENTNYGTLKVVLTFSATNTVKGGLVKISGSTKTYLNGTFICTADGTNQATFYVNNAPNAAITGSTALSGYGGGTVTYAAPSGSVDCCCEIGSSTLITVRNLVRSFKMSHLWESTSGTAVDVLNASTINMYTEDVVGAEGSSIVIEQEHNTGTPINIVLQDSYGSSSTPWLIDNLEYSDWVSFLGADGSVTLNSIAAISVPLSRYTFPNRIAHSIDYKGAAFVNPLGIIGDGFTYELEAESGPITGVFAGNDYQLIFTKAKIYRITRGAKDQYIIERVISNNVGCVAPRSIVNINDTCFFLADNGVWACDGSRVQYIGDAISKLTEKYLDRSWYQNACAGVDTKRNTYMIAVPLQDETREPVTTNNTILAYDYVENNWRLLNFYLEDFNSFGLAVSGDPDYIENGDATATNGWQYLFRPTEFINVDGALHFITVGGIIFKMRNFNRAYDFRMDVNPITQIFQTKWLNLGANTQVKQFDRVGTEFVPQENNCTNTLTYSTDYNGSEIEMDDAVITASTISQEYSRFGTFRFGSRLVETDLQDLSSPKGKALRLTYTNANLDETCEISSITVTAKLLGDAQTKKFNQN